MYLIIICYINNSQYLVYYIYYIYYIYMQNVK